MSKTGDRKAIRWWRLAMVAATLLAGCGVLSEAAHAPSVAPKTPVVIATPVPAPTVAAPVPETPVPVVIPTLVRAPLATGTIPGPCFVTEACVGQTVKFPGGEGIGFLVSKGQPVFAPMSGKAIPGIVDGSTIPVITLGVVYDGKPAALSLYNVKTTLRVGTEVKAGQPLGVVASDEKILDAMYNFDITARPAGLRDSLYPKLLQH